MLRISASCSVRLSSVSSLFGNEVTRIKSRAANSGRDCTINSRTSRILKNEKIKIICYRIDVFPCKLLKSIKKLHDSNSYLKVLFL